MKAISLFSGIGGFDLGFERAGIETVLQVEQDKHCLAVLERHWPNVRRLDDVRDVGAWVLDELGPIDVIHGGPPCQPVSVAGQQRGIDDDRWLWDEVIRIVRELRPRYAVMENPTAILDGRWFGGILGALAESGYDTEWDCIPAAAVGAPHLRDRVFLVAYPGSGWGSEDELRPRRHVPWLRGEDAGKVAYPNSERRDGRAGQQWKGRRAEPSDGSAMADANSIGAQVQTERGYAAISFFGGDCAPGSDRAGAVWESEPDVGRTIDGFSAWLDEPERLDEPHMLTLAYANATQARPSEILRDMQSPLSAKNDGRPPGRHGGVSAAEVLFAFLCKLTERSEEGESALASASPPEDGVRGVWANHGIARSPHGRATSEQRPGKPPDSLHSLSQLLARHAESAWASYRRENASTLLSGWAPGWDDGFDRVAHGVPNRVDRLRSLGNAVVPQVAQWIGQRLIAVDSQGPCARQRKGT